MAKLISVAWAEGETISIRIVRNGGGGGQFLLLTVLNIPFYCQFQKFVLKAMNLKNYDRMERDAV